MHSGADGEFTYYWEYKTEESDWIPLEYYAQVYYPDNLIETTLFSVKVTSPLCQTTATTDPTEQIIYPILEPGNISGEDVICYNEIPELLQDATPPSGGDGTYTYEWYEATNILDWNSSEIYTLEYQPGPLTESTYYMLEYTSGSDCGTVFSNSVHVLVHELPDTCNIIGPSEVCSNQSLVAFSLSNTSEDYNYQWTINHGEFMGGDGDDNSMIHFYNTAEEDTLYLEQIVDSTGCSNIMSLPVTVNETLAPDQGHVIRKPNTNILITNDSTINIIYTWGYTDKATGIEMLTESTNRYSLMPHLDVDNYWYWVDTYFDEGCVTRSYYNSPNLPSGFDEISNELITVYPNPTNDFINLNSNSIESIEIYSLNGELLINNYQKASIDISQLPPGIYILNAVSFDFTSSHKIIKQ